MISITFVLTLCFSSQGFLAKDLQAEALSKLDHRVKIAAEQFMKILEQIDALVIGFSFSLSYLSLYFIHVSFMTNT